MIRSLVLTAIATGVVAFAVTAMPPAHSADERPKPNAASKPAMTTTERATTAKPAAQLWTCGMHPQVIQDHPGECPICHMELTPLESEATKESDGGSAVTIDPAIVQNMGVRTARVIEGPLRREIRVAGFVEEAEPLVRDVSLRFSGWIRRLHAHTEGLHVAKGDPLFEVYSPELQVAVEELIALRKRRGSTERAASRGAIDGAATRGDPTLAALWNATQRKLALFDIDEAEIARLSRLERAPETLTLRSPISGEITEKPVVEGSAFAAGDKLLRIVNHSTLWIDARVYEQDFALVTIGQHAEARVAARADRTYHGRVVFVHPHLDETTRTASVRMAVENPGLELRPGMFATVVLKGELASSAILVPREAVIDTGDRQVTFVVGDKPGHFEPRRVKTGWTAEGGNVQILEGLAAGQEVVVSGQFLLDAESRLQDALRKFISQRPATGTDEEDSRNEDRPAASSSRARVEGRPDAGTAAPSRDGAAPSRALPGAHQH